MIASHLTLALLRTEKFIMAKRDKRLQKARNNPKGVSFDDLRGILENHGFNLDHATGSHHIFEHEDTGDTLSIPSHDKTVKPVYVKQVLVP